MSVEIANESEITVDTERVLELAYFVRDVPFRHLRLSRL